jgi:hypothetical protein
MKYTQLKLLLTMSAIYAIQLLGEYRIYYQKRIDTVKTK